MPSRCLATCGIVLLSATAVLAAALEILFVPLRSGTSLVPLAVAGAVVGNVVLPWLAYRVAGNTRAALGPVVFWLVAVLALAMVSRPEGDVLVRGSNGEQYVFYGILFGGLLAGLTMIMMFAGRPRRDERSRQLDSAS